ncbi:DUF1194 domain-containing protein [Oricola cellulosilytica]|uniref:DUF1194 domain-containing protein n=2 Tax=Oricola cellulosilytica TaxID=1429082 RepID=A0A4V2MP06_9HYPH|nr:DUF1194 domain-containing protein [Oricola cellulosilytica]
MSQQAVDVALVLAVDVSLSMSAEELQIQREGYATAISSPEVVNAIRQGGHGRIAVTMFEWAADSHAREVLGWTVIETRDDAERIAASLVDSMSYGQRRTSISGAIVHASSLLQELPFAAQRYVIDISGDGPNNQGAPVVWARDEALRKGFTINGLPLMTRSGPGEAFNISDLDTYYSRCVIGGPGSFMIPVNDWDQFAEAVRRKLVLEIGELSSPGLPVVKVQFEQDAYDCLIGEKIWQQRLWQYDDSAR